MKQNFVGINNQKGAVRINVKLSCESSGACISQFRRSISESSSGFLLGLEATNQPHPNKIMPIMTSAQIGTFPLIIRAKKLNDMLKSAKTLAPIGITPWLSHAISKGPKKGCW
jgi:hypothetical protein